MLVTTHALMALNAGWQIVTATKTAWQAFLAGQGYPLIPVRNVDEPQDMAGVLYDFLTAEKVIDIESPLVQSPADEGIVMGRAARIRIYVSAGESRLINETLGQNMDVDSPASIDEQANVSLAVIAPTRALCECLGIVVRGILAMQTPWFCQDMGYERAQYVSTTLPREFKDMTKEGNGGFMSTVRWLFERSSEYPPIFGPESIPAYLSIHATDTVDQWGNPGRVRTRREE